MLTFPLIFMKDMVRRLFRLRLDRHGWLTRLFRTRGTLRQKACDQTNVSSAYGEAHCTPLQPTVKVSTDLMLFGYAPISPLYISKPPVEFTSNALPQFTTGSTPGVFDTSFWITLGVSGFVPTSSRGFVNGKAIGIPSAFSGLTTVGWANSAAQYWAAADASTGDFSSPAMISGTYTMSCEYPQTVLHTWDKGNDGGADMNSV